MYINRKYIFLCSSNYNSGESAVIRALFEIFLDKKMSTDLKCRLFDLFFPNMDTISKQLRPYLALLRIANNGKVDIYRNTFLSVHQTIIAFTWSLHRVRFRPALQFSVSESSIIACVRCLWPVQHLTSWLNWWLWVRSMMNASTALAYPVA